VRRDTKRWGEAEISDGKLLSFGERKTNDTCTEEKRENEDKKSQTTCVDHERES
jgi:hypothetical protein